MIQLVPRSKHYISVITTNQFCEKNSGLLWDPYNTRKIHSEGKMYNFWMLIAMEHTVTSGL
jgi:endo-1,4-beta-D-glucanase Y